MEKKELQTSVGAWWFCHLCLAVKHQKLEYQSLNIQLLINPSLHEDCSLGSSSESLL